MTQKIAPTFAATLLLLFNLLDTLLTLKYIKYGPLDEANPLMAMLLDGDGGVFGFIKIFVTTIFTIFLWINRDKKLSRVCLYILSFFYSAIMVWWFLVIFVI
jgi:hypothetical protein